MKKFDFKFEDIVELAKDVIIVTKSYPIDDPGPEIVYVNKAFTELTGYTQEDVIGKTPRILQSKGTDEKTKKIIRQRIEKKIPVRVTIMNYSKYGEEYWLDLSILPLKNSHDVVTHFVAIQRDVTEQKNIEKKLEILSRTDSLTELLNRRAFNGISENEFSRFKRNGDVYTILMIDIDHFKSINDTYGHETGDFAIKAIAEICQKNLRLHDTVARIGGEEFCVLLPFTNKQTAYKIAEKLRKIISNTLVTTKDHNISMTISIGISEVNGEDIDHMVVFKRADENLYKAKNSGRNRVYK